MNRFDEMAATWDEDPIRRERARKLADELRALIRQYGLKKGLDFGSGTGLVSFHLLDDLEQIDLIDVSEGMTRQVNEKIKTLGVSHVRAFTADLTREDWPYQYDCIYTLLTLHHIHDVEELLLRFRRLLHPGGILCIADLDQEDGSFHSNFPDFDGHNGFDQKVLAGQLKEAGFAEVHANYFFTLRKESEDGRQRDYPLFLMVGK